MDLDITKNWLEQQTLSLEVGTEFNKLIAEVERLKAENERVAKRARVNLASSGKQFKENDRLRKALEHTNKTLKSLEAVYDCCKLPDGYDVEATCLADEALKGDE